MLRKNPKFDIKLKYRKIFEIGLILSLVLIIVGFKAFPDIEKEINLQIEPPEQITVESIPNIRDIPVPPAPPKPIIPIEAPIDEELVDIPINENELDPNAEVNETQMPPVLEDDSDLSIIFRIVEKMPQPIGGIAAIQKKIIYPEVAKRAGVQGKVFVKAFVDEKGNVFKAELIKGIGAGCDIAAIAAVLKTKFKPGKQRGKPVRVHVSIPIQFKLN